VPAALFASAEEFLAASRDREFALVIVDVTLGGMSGLDLLEALATEGRPARAIVITAHVTEATGHRARLLGARVLCKPVEGSELLVWVAAALGPSVVAPAELTDLSREEPTSERGSGSGHMDEAQVLAAARAYAGRLTAADAITAARLTGGPIRLDDGRRAWLVQVVANPCRFLVGVAAGKDGALTFGHIRLPPERVPAPTRR
jgi:DNA-binding response OmpR family regulator